MYHGRFLTDTTAIKVYQVSNENTYFIKNIIALIAYSYKLKRKGTSPLVPQSVVCSSCPYILIVV